MQYWLLSGTPENWEIALEKGVWGVSEKAKGLWNKIREGDVVVFYATGKKGILGYGRVVEKYRDETPLWPREKEEGRCLWPLKIKFKVEKIFKEPKPRPKDVFVAFAINKLTQEKFNQILK